MLAGYLRLPPSATNGSRFPRSVSAYTGTMEAITKALEAAGVEFTNDDAPGVRLGLSQGWPLQQSHLCVSAARGQPQISPNSSRLYRIGGAQDANGS